MDNRAYPRMKSIEPTLGGKTIPWLATIPEHWELVRSKPLFVVRKERARPDDKQLSATQAYGVILQEEYERRIGRKVVRISQHLEKRAHVEPDDFVISMRSFQGGLERAWVQGCIRSSYVVLEPSEQVCVGYFAHLFKSYKYIEALQATSNYIRDGQDLNYNNFALVDIPLPPYAEQQQIARVLDYKTSRIAKFIKTKRKLIALLNEQKQAIINQAVTRGFDPNVRLKPSGVDYLGDIPEHWEVVKLKRIVGFNPSKQESAQNLHCNDGVVFLPMEKVSAEGVIDCSELRPVAELWSGFTYFRKNDVVVAKITPCFENGKGACLDNLETPIGFGTTEFIVMRPGNRILAKYLYYITRFSRFRILGKEAMTGAAGQQRVPTDFMKDFMCGLPDKSEQAQIVEQIEDALCEIDHLIERAKTEIDLFREYRTRLISDVVTGKLDVRGIKIEDVDASEVLDDLDEADDDALLDEEVVE